VRLFDRYIHGLSVKALLAKLLFVDLPSLLAPAQAIEDLDPSSARPAKPPIRLLHGRSAKLVTAKLMIAQ
jgi:hypothetical protein